MLLYREGAIDARFAIGNTPTEGLLPVLILHGTLDTNTEPSGSQHFCDRIGSVDKTLKLYEGSFHDLLNDIDKSVVMQDIQDWINVRIPAALAARLPWVNFPCIELGRAVFTPTEIKEGQQNDIYGKQRPNSQAHRLPQLRAQLGNEIAITAYREGRLPFPGGSITIAGGNTNV